MRYRILIKSSANAELDRLPSKHRRQIEERIAALADDPQPRGVEVLQGQTTRFYRVRSGDYRIIYHVERRELIVLVVKIGHRREVYRGF